MAAGFGLRRAAVRGAALAGLVVLAAAAPGCVDERDGISGTQSIRVELLQPANPGDVQNRLAPGLAQVRLNLSARGVDGEVDTSFDRDVQVYVQYLGTLTPELNITPLATLRIDAGQALDQVVPLPTVYGPTTLWIDDGQNREPTYATGTSPTLWFRDPYIADLQTPPNEVSPESLYSSPLINKQVAVGASRHGAMGRLIVTSVFAQGYTVSDARCADASGAPPCTAGPYDHVLVFSFSAPRDQMGRLLQQGQVIDGFSGGIVEFNGLTEIGFPATRASSDEVVAGRLPEPVLFDASTWFRGLGDPLGQINFERFEAAAIEIRNARVCNLDNDYVRFQQWKIDPSGRGGDCSGNRIINVITTGVIGDLDPATLVGQVLPRLVGVLRPLNFTNGGSIWIVHPRSAADLTLSP